MGVIDEKRMVGLKKFATEGRLQILSAATFGFAKSLVREVISHFIISLNLFTFAVK
jgi:hypothetical protein